ncbi:hypothetical protein [Burkholderia gladioli]
MDDRTDAYHDGAQAYRQGWALADNPHMSGSDEAMDWFDGWNDAANS